MMKKNLLLIFGLLGLVSLMAESGPKKSNLLSKLGLGNDATCCDVSVCCTRNDTNCCDMSTCCTTVPNCCAPTSSCCATDATEQTNAVNTEKKVSHSTTQDK